MSFEITPCQEVMSFPEFCEHLKLDGAFIGNDWHIYRSNGKPLSRQCRNGYYMVRKMYNGKTYHFMEHRVIWYFCVGSIDPDKVVNHKDFDRTNNNIKNLELVTQHENVEFSRKNGRYPSIAGPNHHRAALTEKEVQAIRYLAANGWKRNVLAELFNANNRNLISRVVTKARYGNVEDAESIIAIYPTIVMKTHSEGNYRETLSNIALGLCGECGEVADIIKKHLYHGHDLDINELVLEMGDVLYYLCWLCLELGIDFSEICFANMAKLNERYPDGFDSEKSIHRKEYENE